MNKPVLFLIFKRPDTTKKVFDVIKKVKPPRLYIAADGPRENKEGEYEKCLETRKIVEDIDWDCKVKTLFRDKNLGCGKAVSSAIDWFFKNEEDGIILEDDCLPDITFFDYSETLLDYYKNNEKIMHISGNQLMDFSFSNYSYYFASIQNCWGWASWARAWQYFDLSLQKYSIESIEKNLYKIYSDANMRNYWKNIYIKMINKEIDTWDYQWLLSIIANDGICIDPSINLVSNIGFSNDATHTLDVNNNFSNTESHHMKNIVHPPTIERSSYIDELIMSKVFYVPNITEEMDELKNKITCLDNKIEDLKLYDNWIKIFGIYNNKKYLKIVFFGFKIVFIITQEKINKISWWIPIRRLRDNFRRRFE